MAKQIITTEKIIDDIDGAEDAETFTFRHAGVTYTIDAAGKNAAALMALEEKYGKFVEHARPLPAAVPNGKVVRGATRGPAVADREQNQAIRDWAVRQGFEVAPRGRIKQEIVDAYHRAAGR